MMHRRIRKTRVAVSVALLGMFVGMLLVILTAHAHGQPASAPASAPLNPEDPWSVLAALANALQTHAWGLALAAVLVLTTLGLRYGSGALAARLPAGRLQRLMAWFTTDRGGAVLVLVSGVLGAVLVALVAGKAVTPAVLSGGFSAGLTAAGGWQVVKRLIAPVDANGDHGVTKA